LRIANGRSNTYGTFTVSAKIEAGCRFC
jgi:hypothetical protein